MLLPKPRGIVSQFGSTFLFQVSKAFADLYVLCSLQGRGKKQPSSLNKIKFHVQEGTVLQHHTYILNYYVVLKVKIMLSFKIKRVFQLKSQSPQISFSFLENFIISILRHFFKKNINFSSLSSFYQRSSKMPIRTVLIALTFSFRIGEYGQAIKLHSQISLIIQELYNSLHQDSALDALLKTTTV